jgi:hypothetical protein
MNGMKWILSLALVLLLLGVGTIAGYYFGYQAGMKGLAVPEELMPSEPDLPVACTMEAKLCPDGSYVGRTGPDCEFSPCPGE